MSDERIRTIRWEDPGLATQRMFGLAGIDYLRAVASGELPEPPSSALLGLGPIEVLPGSVAIDFLPSEYHYGRPSVVAPGVIGAVCDAAMNAAVQSLLSAGTVHTALEFKINVVRPVNRDTGIVRCSGIVLDIGRGAATAQARVVDARGELHAHAIGTFLVLAAALGR